MLVLLDLPRERPQRRTGDDGLLREEVEERLARRGPHVGVAEREDRGGPGHLAEQRELAEERRLVDRRVEHARPVRRDRADLHPAVDEEHDLAGWVALVAEVRAATVAADRPAGRERADVAVADVGEQRRGRHRGRHGVPRGEGPRHRH